MREFEYYLRKHDVKRQSKDSVLAPALIKSGLDRIRKALGEQQTEENEVILL